MYSGRITNCYDSHSHLLATGEMQLRLNLRLLRSPRDVANLKVESQNKKGGWLIGFGYDESKWNETPTRQHLDEIFPDVPVVFSRVDGHVYWVNTKVLKLMGWLDDHQNLKIKLPEAAGGEIGLDDNGTPTGIFIDAAKPFVDSFIPKSSETETQSYLLAGMRAFHENGFTHVRDMSCSEIQWNELLKLEASGLLTLAIEQTFSADTPEQFDEAYDLAKRALRVPLKKIKAQALKIYYDGALGSEGAYLSQDYGTTSGHRGLKLLTSNQLQSFIQLAWELPLDVAVHVIGDQAADDVADVTIKLWEKGLKGHLHLEHAQVMRTETIEKLKGRSVTCHMQPCHWLSDRAWLEEKLGALKSFAFPWRELQKNDIEFFFGSDSPISRPNINDSIEAIQLSKEYGIPALKGDADIFHSHPNHQWIANCFTIFEMGKVKEVVFDGAPVFTGDR